MFMIAGLPSKVEKSIPPRLGSPEQKGEKRSALATPQSSISQMSIFASLTHALVTAKLLNLSTFKIENKPCLQKGKN